jgi:NitT/TauT family transport system substrate-binding protein
LIFEKDSFELLQDILQEAGVLNERVPYEDLVDNTWSEKVVK